jgi:hypothetical protein
MKTMSAFKLFLPQRFKSKITNSFNMLHSSNQNIQNAVQDFGYTPANIEEGFRELSEGIQK